MHGQTDVRTDRQWSFLGPPIEQGSKYVVVLGMGWSSFDKMPAIELAAAFADRWNLFVRYLRPI